MNRRSRLIAVWMSLVSGYAAVAADSPLKAAEERVLEQFKKVNSFSAKFNTETAGRSGTDTFRTVSTGVADVLKKDGKTLLRMEFERSIERSNASMSAPELIVQRSLSILDGEYQYAQTEFAGRVEAWKFNINNDQNAFDVVEIWKFINEQCTAIVLPDEKLGEDEVIVVEATPIPSEIKRTWVRQQYFFAKNSGVLLKRVGFDRNDQPIETFVVSDVKVNAEIDPTRFVFKPAEGVKFVDMTNLKRD